VHEQWAGQLWPCFPVTGAGAWHAAPLGARPGTEPAAATAAAIVGATACAWRNVASAGSPASSVWVLLLEFFRIVDTV